MNWRWRNWVRPTWLTTCAPSFKDFSASISLYPENIEKNSIWTNHIITKSRMVVHSLEIEKDPFRPQDIGEKMLGLRFHILVSLEHLCILQIASGLILHLQ